MKTFAKKYQLWTAADGAYTFKEFDTLAGCISEPKYSEWYITKGVTIAVTEAADVPLPTPQPESNIQMVTGKDLLGKVDEILTDEEKAYERLMAGGRVANLN